jgi:CCR4-NOT transcriptional complex subunit CAF120
MNEPGGRSLQNILSVSTAANNRYLFHFSSLNSLTQWTAAIRLSMFEQTTLQEAYTGSLIAGKGKNLNNIRQIMEKSVFKYEDWTRVRFGAGTPWRRCWFVVTPPDEKEVAKAQKEWKKKPYGKAPVFKGDLKFYETKRITKKTKPIATIKDVFSAYAVYPQSKPLIDQSTLVKIEGRITIHAESESTRDGFVFVMPELHPAVTGFEIMLRFLFRVWDTFAIYGRPGRLIADVRDKRGLMFALPANRKYGYLELLDVCNLMHTDNSQLWTERDWRLNLKELTSNRMNIALESQEFDTASKANASRTSLPPTRNGRLNFANGPSRRDSQTRTPEPGRRSSRERLSGIFGGLHHRRSVSDNLQGHRGSSVPAERRIPASRDSGSPPAPPPHKELYNVEQVEKFDATSNASSNSGDRTPERTLPPEVRAMVENSPSLQPVGMPPVMAHAPNQKPISKPLPLPQSAPIDNATLVEIDDVARNPVVSPQPSPSRSPNTRMGGVYQFSADRGAWTQEEEFLAQQHYGYPPSSKNRYNPTQPSRLATIPASPFVDQGGPDSAKTPNSYFPQEATIVETLDRPSPPVQTDSFNSIHRKPMPTHNRSRSTSPRKTPSPSKMRSEPSMPYTPPRMGQPGLGPGFDPRGSPNNGPFGPPLGPHNGSPAYSSPTQYHNASAYTPHASPLRHPHISPGYQNQVTPPGVLPNVSPHRQPYHTGGPMNQSPQNTFGRPLPPSFQSPRGPLPVQQESRQVPIPMRGGPPSYPHQQQQNGPYPQPQTQNGPYPSYPAQLRNQNGPYPSPQPGIPPHMINQQGFTNNSQPF